MADATPTLADAGRARERLRALAELELPAFRGAPGWEFTPIDKLDLDAFAPAPPAARRDEPLSSSADASVPVDAPSAAVVRGPAGHAARAGGRAAPRARRARTSARVVDAGENAVRRAQRRRVGRRRVRLRAARRRGRGADRRSTRVQAQAGSALHWRVLIVLEEGAEAEVWEQYVSAADGEGSFNTVVELVVGAERAAALRLRPGPRRERMGLRHPAREGRAATASSTGSRSASARATARSSRRHEARRRGRRAAGSPAPTRSHGRQHLDFDTTQEHAAAEHDVATSPSAASSPTARPRCGAG